MAKTERCDGRRKAEDVALKTFEIRKNTKVSKFVPKKLKLEIASATFQQLNGTDSRNTSLFVAWMLFCAVS